MCWQTFFTSAFTKDPGGEMPDIEPKPVPVLNDIVITPELVKKNLIT